MSSHVAGFQPRSSRPPGAWERSAVWMAPLLVVALVALATLVMFASSGASLI
jgi:hypothetical protein